MTREQKIDMVAGTTGHSASFINELTKGNDSLLDNMVVVAKEQITGQVSEARFEAMA